MKRVKALLSNRLVRFALIVVVVGATFIVFANYLITHPDVISLLFSLSPAALILLAIAYIGTIVANAFVLSVSLRMLGKSVSFSENVSLTGYSSVVNFFGPLQSGPGFRAAYLKQRHGVSLKSFFYATVIFYGFFAAINALVILVALLPKLTNVAAIIGAGVALALMVGVVVTMYKKSPKLRSALQSIKLTSPYFWLIGFGALLLSVCTTFAYYIELLHVDPTVNLLQTTVYSAAANLSLFVSLTPGAIGFRESFLLLSQQLHQIPANVVLGASIIDRAFYVVFLLVMFAGLVAAGVSSRFSRKSSK